MRSLRRSYVLISAALACLAASAGCDGKKSSGGKIGLLPQGAQKPNIVFILVDTLRADRLGVYGHQGGLTPVMDRLAGEGVAFDRCIAPAPWTLPSCSSIYSSYYAGVHQVNSYRQVQDMVDGKRPAEIKTFPNDQIQTLPVVLRASGYNTAGFVANKFLKQEYGFAGGYDHYDTSFSGNTVRGLQVNAPALKWLEQGRDRERPFFLYVHYMDVHGPYDAEPRFMDPLLKQVEANPNKRALTAGEFKALNPYLKVPPTQDSDPSRWERLKGYREYWVARYEAGVAAADFYLGELIDGLKRLGVWENTLVILTADHGEALCEHGVWDHGLTLYQSELHVPLVMRWPNVLPQGAHVGGNAQLIDIMPTLLEQLRLPAGENLQGISLIDWISGKPATRPRPAFAESPKFGGPAYAAIDGDWKLMQQTIRERGLDGKMRNGPVQSLLFDLQSDPGETKFMNMAQPEVLKRLTAAIAAQNEINRTLKPGLVVGTRTVSAAESRHLNAVGYAGSGDVEDQQDDSTGPEAATQPAPSASQPATATRPSTNGGGQGERQP